ncbi:MAG TPA: ABC transporter ATP-binding protein [Bacteroidia bacterium]|nr:ABC transporter ATP-binding protein [Bacteroidia bacterium]
MKPILEIQNLSKKFRINHELGPYMTFRERLLNLTARKKGSSSEDFWALRDINFNVAAGEAIGIIGKNGAGKSTLLKILSRITPPTTGKILSRGRIASLLEVGTGFHPELSGRENIYLNGSILGMRRKEIQEKFDAIVDFSGVERFLDTPLKHYSSGMQLRLAFSVAAFLEPEILIIDEILAVGDAEFQRKCMGKMDEVAHSGRTIIFVSHNLGAVKSLCQRAILLKEGKIDQIGNSTQIVEYYLSHSPPTHSDGRQYLTDEKAQLKLKMPYWIDGNGKPTANYVYGDNQTLRFELELLKPIDGMVIGMAVVTRDGNRLFTSHSIDDKNFKFPAQLSGKFNVETSLNLPTISPGVYEIIFGIKDKSGETLVYSSNELFLDIQYIRKEKDGDDGLLWHTGSWKCFSN